MFTSSSIKWLYGDSSNTWKIITSYLIDNSNLSTPTSKIKSCPTYYKQIFKSWSENLSSFPNLPSAIASQVIWYNKCIKVDNKNKYNFKMSQKDKSYVRPLFKCNSKPKLWEESKHWI